MSGVELKTAKYFETQDELGFEDPASMDDDGLPRARTASWEKAAAWIGVGAAGLVVVCLALIALPYVTGIKLPKAASPIDWWLWLGGAKSDQTFEKFVRDTATKNQNDWDEKYRQSPIYQFKGIQPIDLNRMQGMQFNGQQTTQSPRRSR
jgi:hypothetical protein